jgi:hypothetical protein
MLFYFAMSRNLTNFAGESIYKGINIMQETKNY